MSDKSVFVVIEDTEPEDLRIVCDSVSRAMTELEILQDQYPDRRYTIVEVPIFSE